ncbi:MAG: class I SAM-dependent methyltransferase [Streptosporangiaceae bacterium]
MTRSPDRWHRWLLSVRFGGDAAYRDRHLAEVLYPVRDTVLDKAGVGPGDTLLDVGTGDGLIAFGALDRVGPAGRVIFSDISADLLEHCRQAARAEGVDRQCQFVRAAADHLAGVADATVDAVTTRSVLIYVKDKAAALREFRRVLRPGGRVSLFEPINVLMSVEDAGEFAGYDVTPVAPLAARVAGLYRSIQPRDDDPMIDFDERDLVRHAVAAGFEDVELELRFRVRARKEPVPWDRFLLTSGNPLIPPVGEAVERVLTPAEAAEFYRHLRPLVESGTGTDRMALAYLTARAMIAGDSQSAGDSQ